MPLAASAHPPANSRHETPSLVLTPYMDVTVDAMHGVSCQLGGGGAALEVRATGHPSGHRLCVFLRSDSRKLSAASQQAVSCPLRRRYVAPDIEFCGCLELEHLPKSGELPVLVEVPLLVQSHEAGCLAATRPDEAPTCLAVCGFRPVLAAETVSSVALETAVRGQQEQGEGSQQLWGFGAHAVGTKRRIQGPRRSAATA